MRISLTNGLSKTRSEIGNDQSCLNLYCEVNEQDAASPTTHYPTPGLTLLSTPPSAGMARGAYRASTGNLYAVAGSTLYAINQAWAWTALGTIAAGTTPVSMSDNGSVLVVVDGTNTGGYSYTFPTMTAAGVFAQITDEAFLGSDRVDFIDTFFVFNEPGTPTFYTSNSNSIVFDALYFADKTAAADNLVAAVALQDQLWLIGTATTEVWINSGGATFPFTKVDTAFLQQGCAAKFSITTRDNIIYWLAQNDQGRCVVMEGGGYQGKRISTHAIEALIQSFATYSDCVADAYQFQGHEFVRFHFPIADRTLVYDATSQFWHEVASTDNNGRHHRHRACFAQSAYGSSIALDWQTGALYKLDGTSYTDNGLPIQRKRSFPHLMSDGARVRFLKLQADMDGGRQPAGFTSAPPEVSLRWSDDRGGSWSNPVMRSVGSTGQYLTFAQWQRLGMARDRVFELSWSFPYFTALNGAFVELEPLSS